MEIDLLIQKRKNLYNSLVYFIKTDEIDEDEFLSTSFAGIVKNKEEMIYSFKLLSKIADNHHRTPIFFTKLEKIIHYLIQEKQFQISDFEIYQIFQDNKLFLLNLLEKELIRPDEQIISDIMKRKDINNFPYKHYLISGIKKYIDQSIFQMLQYEISFTYHEQLPAFEEKCKKGENCQYICTLIRQDSVEEFIRFVNQNNLSLLTHIEPTIYETNLFLMRRNPTLIEYASFFGSIQIIRYLRYNKVPITNLLLSYAIHSNNAELIHFLEENKEEEDNEFFGELFKESIICHHNEIANYIRDIYFQDNKIDSFESIICDSYNYEYFPAVLSCLIISRNITTKYDGFTFARLGSSLTEITIQSPVNSIGSCAFNECRFIKKIAIPSSVNSINSYAFRKCSSLAQVSFLNESSLKSIEFGAFLSCSSLNQIIIPSSVISIGNCAFYDCSSLMHLLIPSSVTSIGNCAFYGCSALVDVSFSVPSSVTSIGNYAFNECTSLKQVLFPSSVISIGNNCFNECTSLAQISLPYSVNSIGKDIFCNCSSLAHVFIPLNHPEDDQQKEDKTKAIKEKLQLQSSNVNIICLNICSSQTKEDDQYSSLENQQSIIAFYENELNSL